MAARDTQQVSTSWRSDTGPLLTVDEVAALFKVGRRTIWRWANDGRLERVRIGNVSRYTADSIARLITPVNELRPVDPPGATTTGSHDAEAAYTS
jgi:excisionase family DNA binding protein